MYMIVYKMYIMEMLYSTNLYKRIEIKHHYFVQQMWLSEAVSKLDIISPINNKGILKFVTKILKNSKLK